jgi:hypothetical protein
LGARTNIGQAALAFKRAIEFDKTILSSYINLGQLYEQASKLDQAVAEYESVLQKYIVVCCSE